jgi:hypothetical protein
MIYVYYDKNSIFFLLQILFVFLFLFRFLEIFDIAFFSLAKFEEANVSHYIKLQIGLLLVLQLEPGLGINQ